MTRNEEPVMPTFPILILKRLEEGPQCFYGLVKEKTGSPNTILQNLQWLQERPLVTKTEPGIRNRVDYSLTPKGRHLLRLIAEIQELVQPVDGVREAWLKPQA